MILLPWDTDFFGFNVARLQQADVEGGTLGGTLTELAEQDVRLAYLELPPGEIALDRAVRAHGATFINQRVVLNRRVDDPGPFPHYPPVALPIDAADLARLIELAWASAERSRFRIGRRLPPDAWRRLYEIWMRRSLSGEMADAVLAHRHEGTIAGMITVSRREGVGEIGLFAVNEKARGLGIGSGLLGGALGWFSSAGCGEVSVVTQGENHRAVAVYRRIGFSKVQVTNVYHLWIEKSVIPFNKPHLTVRELA